MAISLLPKKKTKRPIFTLRFFRENALGSFLGGIFIILVILFYFGNAAYKGALTREIAKVDQRIVEVQSERDVMVEEDVKDLATRLSVIDSLLLNHTYTSQIFAFLERMTHPAVQFKDFSYRMQGNTITMNGSTQSYTTLGEQIVALEQSSDIKNLAISNIQLDKSGRVLFSISFEVDEALYRSNL